MLKQLLILLAIGTYIVSGHLNGNQNEQPGQVHELESVNGGAGDELELPGKSTRQPTYPVPYPDRNQPPPRNPTPPTMPTIDEDEPLPDNTPVNTPGNGRGRGRRGRGNFVNRLTSVFRRNTHAH